jgi:hypothetical protein
MTLNVHTGRMDPPELESPSPVEQQAAAWQAVWQTLQDVDPNFAAQTGTGKDMVLNSIRGLADRIAQLESELEAVGAGGVQRLDASPSIGTLWVEENGANDLELCPCTAPKLPPGEYALFAVPAKSQQGGA